MSKAEHIIQGALNKVPGYKGYRDKENRRDADKAIREQIAGALGAQVDALTRFNAELANARDFDSLAQLEPFIGQIRLLADRVRHTSYGYGGIFSENDIDANALEQLRLFDAALLREVGTLAVAILGVTSTTPPNKNTTTSAISELNRLVALFDRRNSVVNSGRAAEDETTLQLLAIPEVVEPSPLLHINKGDALSVLGDNYIANGVISLSSNDGQIMLARVTSEEIGATWLLGSSIPGMNSARLIEQTTPTTGYQTLISATARIDTAQGQESDLAVRYAYRDMGDNQVEFTLAIGDTIKQYSGSIVVNKDVEVYGAA